METWRPHQEGKFNIENEVGSRNIENEVGSRNLRWHLYLHLHR